MRKGRERDNMHEDAISSWQLLGRRADVEYFYRFAASIGTHLGVQIRTSTVLWAREICMPDPRSCLLLRSREEAGYGLRRLRNGSIMIDNKTRLMASYGHALVKIIHAVN